MYFRAVHSLKMLWKKHFQRLLQHKIEGTSSRAFLKCARDASGEEGLENQDGGYDCSIKSVLFLYELNVEKKWLFDHAVLATNLTFMTYLWITLSVYYIFT